jgi:hypothetical protein
MIVMFLMLFFLRFVIPRLFKLKIRMKKRGKRKHWKELEKKRKEVACQDTEDI